MATMQTLLEKDKERFLQNMAAAKSSAESVRALEEQLSRLLTAYNEEEESLEVKTNARLLVETLSSSAGLLDCDGESTIWSKSQYRKIRLVYFLSDPRYLTAGWIFCGPHHADGHDAPKQ